MSLPPSSFARGAPPSTSVPASQNTAPVIKFRCLYTHDIRRKAKRWQDGYLKFHTFNKRAMVYDDSGNFIGDHHWRESQDIQDGDELELDKGVLIQVSECMETTQTDISVLFDRRKASQESPQKTPTPTPIPAPPPPSRPVVSSLPRQTPLASRPPKSLNDLLGIQRGPVGRSVTPQSPYEQCHRAQTPQRPVENKRQEDERPAKRQKPAPPPASEILQRKSSNEPLRKRPEVIDLDNDSSLPKPPSKPAPVPSVSRDADKPKKSSNVSSGSRPQQESSSNMPPPSEKPPEKPKPITNRTNMPMNPLRMRSEKPRPKLMYRALLPPKTSDALASGEAPANSNQPAGGREPEYDFSISASTLAVLEELNEDPDATATITRPTTTRPPQQTPKTSISQNSQSRLLKRIPTHTAVYGPLASPAGVELGDEFGPFISSSPDMQEQEHDHDRAVPTTVDRNRPVPAVGRSHSDMSSIVTESMRKPPSNNNNPSSGPAAPETEFAHPANIIKRNERKSFRKSHSDTNALRNLESGNNGISRPLATRGPPREERNNAATAASASAVVNSDAGPWTAEALDFFDWWPPGRPKIC